MKASQEKNFNQVNLEELNRSIKAEVFTSALHLQNCSCTASILHPFISHLKYPSPLDEGVVVFPTSVGWWSLQMVRREQ